MTLNNEITINSYNIYFCIDLIGNRWKIKKFEDSLLVGRNSFAFHLFLFIPLMSFCNPGFVVVWNLTFIIIIAKIAFTYDIILDCFSEEGLNKIFSKHAYPEGTVGMLNTYIYIIWRHIHQQPSIYICVHGDIGIARCCRIKGAYVPMHGSPNVHLNVTGQSK